MKKIQNKPLRRIAQATALGLVIAVSVSAPAAPIVAYEAVGPGNQSWSGPLGMDFVVNSAIRVLSLGVFEDGDGGLNGRDLIAELWSRNVNGTPNNFNDDTGGSILASIHFSSADPGTSMDTNGDGIASWFKDISPIILNPGNYTIVATGFGGGSSNGNSGIAGGVPSLFDGGGLITAVGGARFGDQGQFTGGVFPNHLDGGPATRYNAGTFIFEAASVPAPVPSTLALATMSLFGVGWLRRKFVRVE